jgi:type I restriction enzyme, R subunit
MGYDPSMSSQERGPVEKDTCRDYVLPALEAANWTSDLIVEQRYFTDGRIIATARGHRREEGRRADYLLHARPDMPISVVEAKREYRLPSDGLQQAMRYAEILGLGFAYSTNGRGIVEHDYATGRQRELTAFPSPDELWRRHQEWRGITPDVAEHIAIPFNRDLRNPDGSVKRPRYYQVRAINAILEAALGGQRRMLVTMATGTGKTFVALQVAWKLQQARWPSGQRTRVLYLADRNVLVDQPIIREFRPVFGEALWKVQGAARTGREVYFALYQALADTPGSLGVLSGYPSDYFDLVIVDECHRGSARDESSWRAILDHFAPAAQLGMTATPLRTDNVDTYRYFGDPLYTYSLAQGIDDGFLAPYRVTRAVLSPDAHGWRPEPDQLDRYGRAIPEGTYTTQDFERVVSLLERTRAAARHLSDQLRRTDRFAKTIVFCVDQEHAEQMRSALHEENADLTRQHPHYVARVVSDEGDVGREHLDAFIDPRRTTPTIVTTSRLLSTGVDVPTCRNIVLFRPVGSIVEFKQIIGRGTRLYPDLDKLSFDILDYTGATVHFADPEFDGVPEATVEEVIDDGGAVIATSADDPSRSTAPDVDVEVDLDEIERQATRKLYVDGGEVILTSESVHVLQRDTGRLRIVEYRDFAAQQVRTLFPHADDLRSRWRNASGRDQVVADLESRGILIGELKGQLGIPEADPFDLLVHVAWNGPLGTRRDRVNRVKLEHRVALERQGPEARAILEALLEKYAEHGIDQLDDLASLELPPLSAFGTPVEIAQRFGGANALRGAVAELGDLLYAA